MKIIKVLFPNIALFPLDYELPKGALIKIGNLVKAPLRNKLQTGIVWEIEEVDNYPKPLKFICDDNIYINITLNLKYITFIKKTSEYYATSLGSVAKLVLPVEINNLSSSPTNQHIPEVINLPKLSKEQEEVLDNINLVSKPVVIKGVTGSGKTEIYFHAIAKCLEQKKQALIMLPEIALSQQIISRFKERFGFEAIIWNSTVTKAKKQKILRGIIEGDIFVVIGARSSLFLPYKNLGLIVVDEEHDQSYKQNDGILYQARDMAILRSFIFGNKVLLVSATPAIETINNVRLNKYQMVELKSRYSSALLPKVEVVDMRQENLSSNSWFSKRLINAIKDNISRKEQTLLFLNRRGYAPLMLCKCCGYRFDCKSCSTSMVVHKSKKSLECHHCGAVSKIYDHCPECLKTDSLILCGPGIERIAEQSKYLFPNAVIEVISKEQAMRPKELESLVKRMEQGDIDILIGTQIITKGYHFPNLTLVGVIDADLGFIGGDLRSSEKMYQLLHQVSGRAGREEKKGEVLLQSYLPDNVVIQALQSGDEEKFINLEINSRELAEMPPFTKMAAIIFTGKNEQQTANIAKQFVKLAPKNPDIRVLGPTSALLSKVSGKFRFRILVLTKRNINLSQYIKMWLQQMKIPSSIYCKVDIDPYNFY